MRAGILAVTSVFSFFIAQAQQKEPVSPKVIQAKVIDGDTLLFVQLPTYDYTEKRTFLSRVKRYRYNRLKKKVLTVYPYAKLAGEKLKYHDSVLTTITTENARKKYMKVVEKDINSTFGKELSDLTISEGVILIKLIDRETGNTSYTLLREYRGQLSAFFWQSLARVFGHNLKSEYEAQGEDKMIEEIIQLIEEGVYQIADVSKE